MFWHGIFWHLNILAHGYFGTLQSSMDIYSQTFRHLCYCAEMSMCQNVPMPKCSCAENSSCWKVFMPKSPHVEMFPCWNVHLPECLQYRMVHMPRSFRDETFVPKWLFLKFSVPKWSIGRTWLELLTHYFSVNVDRMKIMQFALVYRWILCTGRTVKDVVFLRMLQGQHA